MERILSGRPEALAMKTVREEESARIQDILGSTAESAIVDAKYAFIQGALAETYEKYQEEKPRRSMRR